MVSGSPAGPRPARRRPDERSRSTARPHTTDNAARHVMAACDQAADAVLADTDVNGKTNELFAVGYRIRPVSLPDLLSYADDADP